MALQALAELVAQVPRAAAELLAAGGPCALAGVLADDYAQGQLREGAAAVLTALVDAHRGAGAAARCASCFSKPLWSVQHLGGSLREAPVGA